VNLEGLIPRSLSVQVSPLGRELLGSSAVFQDVTELHRLEKVRKDFVANVSHELRTPITAIRGYAETLRGGALADANAAPKMVDIIYRQSERLSELVEDLLELSRIDAKQIQLAQVPVNLSQAAMRAKEAIKPKAEAKQVSLSLTIPSQLTAIADARAVEQVLLNLLDNAVKYTSAGGTVRVTGKEKGSEVEVSVTDSGAGIEARHLSRIFERFYRVDKGRSRELGGTGLGLSSVKSASRARLESAVPLLSSFRRNRSAPFSGFRLDVFRANSGAYATFTRVRNERSDWPNRFQQSVRQILFLEVRRDRGRFRYAGALNHASCRSCRHSREPCRL
jgi:two-component system phosphate regulon sensor histidine kinase PhoR